ncbi:uncharacterized protein LOC115948812 [Geospiza fortis]|uniref:Uncharacterized protein LOC115948812 n=1 Tax=Geospiza fortis TaxID=48883 RepID=A0A8N5I3S6_GEOFO|nr:uncharacterized protein LOC115948812 [Geospiza fortis]
MEQRAPRVLKMAWVEEEEEGHGAARAQETKKVVPFQLPQRDPALERTQEQQSSRGRFRSTAQLVCKFMKRIQEEETITMDTGLRTYLPMFHTTTSAALLSMLGEEDFYNPKQVPAMVRFIHQWLMANDCAEHRLDKALLNLTRAHPDDAVVTLLRVAPSCDRYGAQLPRGLRPPQPITLYSLAQVLECLDLRERDADRVLQIFSRYLQSESREKRRLALRALLKLTDDPSMAEKMWSLTERLVELLRDEDVVIVKITVMVLSFIILDKDTPMPTPIALQLAEGLLPLFDHNNSQVQLLSIMLLRTLLTLPLGKKRKALETQVRHTLLPLFFHCHDGNQRVAQASLETLLCVAEFLKRKDLDKLVKKKKLWMFTGSLVRALEEMANDISLSVRSLALQTLHVIRTQATVRYPILENLEDQLRRAWKTGLRVSGLGRLCCWSSM